MASKKQRVTGRFPVKVELGPLKEKISDFRARKQLDKQPISSDEKAILYLVERGLEAETLNA